MRSTNSLFDNSITYSQKVALSLDKWVNLCLAIVRSLGATVALVASELLPQNLVLMVVWEQKSASFVVSGGAGAQGLKTVETFSV